VEGSHQLSTLDAATVDVLKGTHAVILLVDPSKVLSALVVIGSWLSLSVIFSLSFLHLRYDSTVDGAQKWTFDYAMREIPNIPQSISVLLVVRLSYYSLYVLDDLPVALCGQPFHSLPLQSECTRRRTSRTRRPSGL
jgi:hypothetical protein